VQSIAFTDTAGVKNEIVFYLWGSTYYYNIANSTETVIDTPPSASSVSINSTGAETLSAWSTVVEASNTTALIGSVYANTNKYYGITSAANGKLYCAPYNATQVLEINSVGTFNSFSEFFAFDEFGAPSTIYMNTL
jgi:hypothetical protein